MPLTQSSRHSIYLPNSRVGRELRRVRSGGYADGALGAAELAPPESVLVELDEPVVDVAEVPESVAEVVDAAVEDFFELPESVL